ncbi:MAG: YbhB/YbcL family Raf kinase inhibitor-like protein [Candidatus Methanoplasma sp.]|jgi:Raf kinase inhibitor-like YbhB/YbcL family protein|nr:YbhB/YbcL family Raf kinase inhibitor-like protein [Candidatus Methanoplasma sp.]
MKDLIVKPAAFENEELIPIDYTGHGADISPEIHLLNIDERAKSIAITMDDMGHLMPAYNHWLIWNIPVMEIIPKNIPHGEIVESLSGAVQGCGYGKNGYRGPKPPLNRSHRYQFNVFILDCKLDLPATSKKRDLIQAMEGHILQQNAFAGHYK